MGECVQWAYRISNGRGGVSQSRPRANALRPRAERRDERAAEEEFGAARRKRKVKLVAAYHTTAAHDGGDDATTTTMPDDFDLGVDEGVLNMTEMLTVEELRDVDGDLNLGPCEKGVLTQLMPGSLDDLEE